MNIEIFFDGACNNHDPDPSMGIGIAVYVSGFYQEHLSRAIGYLPQEVGRKGSSNIAEWLACVEAFRIAKSMKKSYAGAQYRIFSDSQLVTNQFNGIFAIRTGGEFFKSCKTKAHNYKQGQGNWICKKVTWIPREKNKMADKLSKEGIAIAKEKMLSDAKY